MRCHQLASSSLLLLLLVAAASLTRVHSVKYYGDESVKNGNKFNITCELPPGSQPYWKLNGRNLLDDFAQGAMRVYQDKEVDGTIVSTLSNTVGAAERHEGSYTCAEGNETHHLIIIYEITIRVLLKSETTTLHCNVPNRTEKVEWTKDNKPLPVHDEKSGLKDLFHVFDDKLNITAPHHLTAAHFPLIYGNYTCRSGNYSADFRVVKKPIVSMTDSSNVVEGEKLHVTCGVKLSDPGVKIKWEFQGKNYTGSEGRVTLGRDEEKGLNNAVFNLNDVNMNDRGNITCHSYYLNEDKPGRISSATTYLRVKDKLAALWPFLGICAEVVILCLIILIYEKKRNKSELEESDTDQSPDTKPTPNKDSDVRHRK